MPDERLLLDMGIDTGGSEKTIRELLDGVNKLDEKVGTLYRKFDKNTNSFGEPFKEINNEVSKLNDGITKSITTISKLDAKSGEMKLSSQVETVTKRLTEQEVVLERVIKKYSTFTSEQKKSKSVLESYVNDLKTVASMDGYESSAATAKANYMVETELNRVANTTQKDLVSLTERKMNLQKELSEASWEEAKAISNQIRMVDKQISDKREIISYVGQERVAAENVYKLKAAELKLNSQEKILELDKVKSRVKNVELLKTEYGYVANIERKQQSLNVLLKDQAELRAKNAVNAQLLQKNLEDDVAKHVNNGTVMGKFMNSAIYSASGFAQYEIFSAMTEGFEAVKQYENGIVDLRRTIQGVTENELKDFGETAISYAKDFGIEIKEVQDAMTELARAGIDDQNTLKDMTETVMIGLNTTEIETAADMTSYLVSTVKQLDMEMSDSMEIIDTWNYLADQYAVHTDDFALAIQRAGSASKNLGLDLYDVNAMVTILGEATQASGQNIGTALRSMEVRLLRPDTIRTLESYGIAVKKNEKEFLSFQEIMSNVNEVIKDMDDSSIDLNNIMDALGGSWRKNWVITLANDWERFDELVAEQHNNMGYSIAENEKAMDTLEKKITQAHQAWLEFLITSANESGLTENLKEGFDITASLLEAMTDSKFTAVIGLIAEATAGMLAIKGILFSVNKILGTDLPTSASKFLEAIGETGNIEILSNIAGRTNSENIGNKLAEQFANATDEAGNLKYSLEEQVVIAEQIDKKFGTSTSELTKQRLIVDDINSNLSVVNAALKEIGSTGLTQDAETTREELIKEQTRLTVESEIQQKKLNDAIANETEITKRSAEVKKIMAMENVKLIASQLALNAAISVGITVITTVLFKVYDELVNKQNNMINAGAEASDAFTSMTEKYEGNAKAIGDLKDRYDQLSSGVNDLGENVSLSADEYAEYLDIVRQVNELTPDIVNGYNTENLALEHKNDLIEESIRLIKEQENIDKLAALNENGVARIEGAVAKARKQSGLSHSNVTIEEAENARRLVIINKDELDLFTKYKSGEANISLLVDTESNQRMAEISKKLANNTDKFRNDVNASLSDAYKTLEDMASTVEGYAELSSNQRDFISGAIKSFDMEDLEENPKLIMEEVAALTESIVGNADAQLLIDQILDADKTTMTMDRYNDLVTENIEDLYDELGVTKDEYDLGSVLNVNDDLENIALVKSELKDLAGFTDFEIDNLLNENSFSAVYDLYEILNKFEDVDGFNDLKTQMNEVVDESGKLNGELLSVLKTLDSGDIDLFDEIFDNISSTLGGDITYSMYDDIAELTDMLSFEDLDPKDLLSKLNEMDKGFDEILSKWSTELEADTDALYEMTSALNEFTQLKTEIADMDKTSKEYYDTMLELGMQYPQYIASINEATGAVELQDGALEEIQEEMEREIIKQSEAIDMKAKAKVALLDYAISGLEAMKGISTAADSAVKSVTGVVSATLNGIGGTIGSIPVISTLAKSVTKWFKDTAKTVKDAGDSIDVSASLDGMIDKLEGYRDDTLVPYQNLIKAASTPYKGGNYGGSGGSKKSSKEEKYKAEADEYHKYTQRLNDINQLLEENAVLEDLMTDSIEDQIKLISERNGLLEMESRVTQNLVDAKKKELNDMVWTLNQQGYNVDWDREANTLMINNYKQLEKVTGDAAKAQEAMLENVVKLNDEIRGYSNTINENTAAIYKNNYAIQEQKWEEEIARKKKMYEQQEELLKDYQDSLNDLIDLSVNMLKKEYEAEKEEIDKVTESYKDLLEAKKEALDDEAAQEDYERELAKKQKEVAELQNKIKEISNDDSAEAVAQKLTLEEELAAAEEELYKYQRDHNLELSKEALDKEFEDFEDMQNDKLDSIDDYLDQEGTLREEAMKQIASQNGAFYDKLLAYNRMYGDGVDATVTKAWGFATQALDEFGVSSTNTLSILADIADEMERIQDAAAALDEEKFIYNKDDTYGTSDATTNPNAGMTERARQQLNQQKYLHNLMVEAKEQNKTGLIAWIKQNRKEWGLDPETGAIVEQFHTGGFVGGKPLLKSNERFAKMLDGEFVVTPEKMDDFMKKIMPSIIERSTGGGVEITGPIINVEGNVDKSTMPALQKAGDNAIKNINAYMDKIGVTRGAKSITV